MPARTISSMQISKLKAIILFDQIDVAHLTAGYNNVNCWNVAPSQDDRQSRGASSDLPAIK